MKNRYYAILGEKPSQGAKSPKLWNRVLKKIKNNERMIPLDIKKKDLKKTIKNLEKDKNFLGGCITTPYKEDICKLIRKNIPKKILKNKSINCIFKDKKGKLSGCNTDGLAALYSLNKNISNLREKKIIIFGLGGTGKAISASLKNFGCKKVSLTNRSPKQRNFSKIVNFPFVNWNYALKELGNYDVIINATSLGFKKKNVTPIHPKILNNLRNKILFDVIYQPKETLFLKIGKKNNKIINGSEMNVMQAVLAFSIVTKMSNKIKIYKHMVK